MHVCHWTPGLTGEVACRILWYSHREYSAESILLKAFSCSPSHISATVGRQAVHFRHDAECGRKMQQADTKMTRKLCTSPKFFEQ
ncbi:hypothetical protein INR49_010592 [Caranx melampygus]|nr:hypothetical protein INR49_010592 [Caranx melampygus]